VSLQVDIAIIIAVCLGCSCCIPYCSGFLAFGDAAVDTAIIIAVCCIFRSAAVIAPVPTKVAAAAASVFTIIAVVYSPEIVIADNLVLSNHSS